jgi:tetratricopeptide (TPR) repeat protein
MPSRRLLALLLETEDAGALLSGLADDLLDSIVSRSLAAGFRGLADDDGLSGLRHALDRYEPPELPDSGLDMPAFCRMLYDQFQAVMPAGSFGDFEAAFRRFVVLLRDALALSAGPQLTDPPCREFGALNLDELSRLQAPGELCRYMARLVTCFRDRGVISASDAGHVIGLVEKMVSAPGYLRFLGEDRKRQEIARLLDLAMVVRSSGVPPGPAPDDLAVTLGLLLYNLLPSEKAAGSLAAVRPSKACPALQYHYNAIMALNYVHTGQLGLAAAHAARASGSTADPVMTTYMSILQGCIALGQGDYRAALDLLERAGSSAPGGRSRALAHFYRGVLFSEKGEYANAIDCFREAGGHVTDPLDRATIHNNVGSCAYHLGDLSLAERSFAEMEKLADHLAGDDARRCRLVAGSHLGAIWHARGDYPRAIERCRQALKLALRSGDGPAVANQMGRLGTAYACAGEAATALQFLKACLASSEHMSYWPGIRFAYWHTGRLLEEGGNKEEARKFLETYASRYPELRDLR